MSESTPPAAAPSTSPSTEQSWVQWLLEQPDPRPALQAFARQYHYFSLHQVAAFSRLLSLMPRTDRTALARFAEVLFEELGGGKVDHVHSVVFEHFAQAIGVDPRSLPLKASEVAGGVRWYVCELELAFGGHSLARALATYVFLETAAVATYEPLLNTLRQLKLGEHELEFFRRHSKVEVEHAAVAAELMRRANLDPHEQQDFDDQTRLLQRCWERFWADVWDACREAAA